MSTSQIRHIRALVSRRIRVVFLKVVALLVIGTLWSPRVAQAVGVHGTSSPDVQVGAIPSQAPICGTPTLVSGAITSNTTWSTSNLYVLNRDVTVNAGVTLTIQPGVVIKAKGGTRLVANGELVADGTVANPIYFTSWKDDTVCGDTNGDGTASVPAMGDWGWIEFGSNSDSTSVVRRAVIRYAGWAAIRLNNVMPTLENITLGKNYRNAAEIVPGNWTTNIWNSTTVIY